MLIYLVTHIIISFHFSAPFVVAFVETMYTVIESEGQVDVCVNLTQPEIDILEETIHVDVFRADNSVYIPNNSVLASTFAIYIQLYTSVLILMHTYISIYTLVVYR